MRTVSNKPFILHIASQLLMQQSDCGWTGSISCLTTVGGQLFQRVRPQPVCLDHPLLYLSTRVTFSWIVYCILIIWLQSLETVPMMQKLGWCACEVEVADKLTPNLSSKPWIVPQHVLGSFHPLGQPSCPRWGSWVPETLPIPEAWRCHMAWHMAWWSHWALPGHCLGTGEPPKLITEMIFHAALFTEANGRSVWGPFNTDADENNFLAPLLGPEIVGPGLKEKGGIDLMTLWHACLSNHGCGGRPCEVKSHAFRLYEDCGDYWLTSSIDLDFQSQHISAFYSNDTYHVFNRFRSSILQWARFPGRPTDAKL